MEDRRSKLAGNNRDNNNSGENVSVSDSSVFCQMNLKSEFAPTLVSSGSMKSIPQEYERLGVVESFEVLDSKVARAHKKL